MLNALLTIDIILIFDYFQHARPASNPDPYLILSVGKKNEQTSVQMRTDSPVWYDVFLILIKILPL
jgi:hypothetical protein